MENSWCLDNTQKNFKSFCGSYPQMRLMECQLPILIGILMVFVTDPHIMLAYTHTTVHTQATYRCNEKGHF